MISNGQVRPILRRLERTMRLQYWKINVHWVEEELWENHATMGIVDGRQEAILTLHRYIQPTMLESVLVHELTHLVLYPIHKVLGDYQGLIEKLGPDLAGLYERQYQEAEEQVTDHFTHIIHATS